MSGWAKDDWIEEASWEEVNAYFEHLGPVMSDQSNEIRQEIDLLTADIEAMQRKRGSLLLRLHESTTCLRCGRTAKEANAFDHPLIDVTVIMAEGEEGYARVTRWACDDDIDTIREELAQMGFMDHRHGGANLLEDTTCEGAYGGTCPTR